MYCCRTIIFKQKRKKTKKLKNKKKKKNRKKNIFKNCHHKHFIIKDGDYRMVCV